MTPTKTRLLVNSTPPTFLGAKSSKAVIHRPLLLWRPPRKPIFGFGRRKTAVFRSAEKQKQKNADWSPAQADFFLSRFSLGEGDFFFFRVPPPPPLQYLNKYEVRGVFSSYGAPGAHFTVPAREDAKTATDTHDSSPRTRTHMEGPRNRHTYDDEFMGPKKKWGVEKLIWPPTP